MTIGINLRRANTSDIPSLVTFNRAMAAETEGKNLAEAVLRPGVAGLFDHPEYGFYLIAETDDDDPRAVASLMITYEWSDWRNGLFWWIQSVYVTPAWRRRGVYRRMYEYVQQLASAENVCGFRLYVEKENVAAQRTYAELGMAETHYLMFEREK
ncbi:MAG: GNAT family N-acetyltransferase [Pyrinomonadaceae bacterium]